MTSINKFSFSLPWGVTFPVAGERDCQVSADAGPDAGSVARRPAATAGSRWQSGC